VPCNTLLMSQRPRNDFDDNGIRQGQESVQVAVRSGGLLGDLHNTWPESTKIYFFNPTCLFWRVLEKNIAEESKVKGKLHPGTGHEDPEGEWMYSSTPSLTSALDGVGGQSHASAALSPGKTRYALYRGYAGRRAGLDGCGKSSPQRDSIPGLSSP
jgi:hypothetical protein